MKIIISLRIISSIEVVLIIISVLLSGPFHDIEKIITGKGRSDTERVGDFLQIMLPSYGLYKTYKIDDKDGRRQLWKSLLSTFVVTYALKYGIDTLDPVVLDSLIVGIKKPDCLFTVGSG